MRLSAVLATVLVSTVAVLAQADLWSGDSVKDWLCAGRTKAFCVDPSDPSLSFHALKSAAVGRFQEYVAGIVRDPKTAPQWLPESFTTALLLAHKSLPGNVELTDDAVLRHVIAQRSHIAPAAPHTTVGGDGYSYPYFGFLPKVLGSVVPSTQGTTFTTATECFQSVNFTAKWTVANVSAVITVAASGTKTLFCEDNLVFAAFGLGPVFVTVSEPGVTQHTVKAAPSGLTAAMRWFAAFNGIRVMRLNKSFLGAALDVIETVTLMSGFGQMPLSNSSFAANVDFMKHYIESSPRMQPVSTVRAAGNKVLNALDESYIQSGDGMVVVRYDGLDPMIGWGEGFTGGHSVLAIRDPGSNDLLVCESTAVGAYWPVNGIQCTPWKLWFQRAEAAEFNVLLAPLAPEYSKNFNTTAAMEFFRQVEGFNYGYLNFLFGWLDVAKKNLPCLPPAYDYCLGEEVVEFVALFVDSAFVGPSNIFRQALNHRLPGGSPSPLLSVGNLMMTAQQKYGMTFDQLYVRTEQDSWVYNTTRHGKPAMGPSLVCCVFVCNMWRRGGVFEAIGNNLQCTEQTLWDIFSMKIFDLGKLGDNRPAVCKAADPTNEQCQLIGGATFQAKPDFNSRSLYPNMGDRCSSQAPDYVRAPGC